MIEPLRCRSDCYRGNRSNMELYCRESWIAISMRLYFQELLCSCSTGKSHHVSPRPLLTNHLLDPNSHSIAEIPGNRLWSDEVLGNPLQVIKANFLLSERAVFEIASNAITERQPDEPLGIAFFSVVHQVDAQLWHCSLSQTRLSH